MRVGEIWKSKSNPDDEEYFVYPEVIKIIKRLGGDMWLVIALYAIDEGENTNEPFTLGEGLEFSPTGEPETDEMSSEEIYKNYSLVRDENFADNYEEGQLYEMKSRDE